MFAKINRPLSRLLSFSFNPAINECFLNEVAQLILCYVVRKNLESLRYTSFRNIIGMPIETEDHMKNETQRKGRV